MPSVPLMSARPSFSAQHDGRDAVPRRARRPRRQQRAVRRRAPAPSPISASAQCASGARSPEQPSEPYSCTTGVMPALSSAAYVVSDLLAHAGAAGGQGGEAQQHQRAHDLALDLGARSRRRASGPGCAAAGRAARRGCGGWRGRRSRWRRRSAARRRRPAPRSPRGCGATSASASADELDRRAVPGDGDDVVEARRAGARRRRWLGGRRWRWWRARSSCIHSSARRRPAHTHRWPIVSRI